MTVSAFLLLVVAAVPTADSPAGAAADAVEQKAVGARRAIRHGHVAYELRAEINGPGAKTETTYRIEVWFDESRCRVDKRFTVPDAKTRVVECRNCGPEGVSMEWHDVAGRTVVPHLGCRGIDSNLPPENLLFDPRAVGMHGSQILHPTNKLTGLLTNPERSDRRVSDIADGRKTLKRVEFTQNGSRNKYAVSLDPDFDCNPFLISCTAANDGAVASFTVRSALSRYGPSGICYPAKVVSEEIGKGGTVLRRVMATVVTADFNPPPEAAFTLKGIGLPAGIPVMMADRRPAKFDGEKLIFGEEAARETRKTEKPRPAVTPATPAYFYYALAGFFACVSVAAGYWAVRRKARLQ